VLHDAQNDPIYNFRVKNTKELYRKLKDSDINAYMLFYVREQELNQGYLKEMNYSTLPKELITKCNKEKELAKMVDEIQDLWNYDKMYILCQETLSNWDSFSISPSTDN
jgi:hypothetical protein